MIVVVGSRFDAAACEVVERWPGGKARLLTIEDLTMAGWQWSDDGQTRFTAVVSGSVVDVESIRGVLTRRPAVLPQELTTIAHADRGYVAAEITAFLTVWLSTLTCPVLNRPRDGCLSGPNWTVEQWLRTAASLGIAVRPCRRVVPEVATSPAQEGACDMLDRVVVVGPNVFGEVCDARADEARRLARAAGVHLLEARFCGPELITATCWPDLASPDKVEAVDRYFGETST